MPRNKVWHMLRMALGSVLGVIGFGTLSLGFVALNMPNMALGIGEILLGAFVALGVLSPLRRHKTAQH